MVLSEIPNPIIATTKNKQRILIFTIMVLDNELVLTVCDMANFICFEEFDYCYRDIIFVWTIHESMSPRTSDNPNWGRMVSWAGYHIQTIGCRSSEVHSATHCCGRHEITRPRPTHQKQIGIDCIKSPSDHNTKSVLGRDESVLGCLHLVLAYRYYFSWRTHALETQPSVSNPTW